MKLKHQGNQEQKEYSFSSLHLSKLQAFPSMSEIHLEEYTALFPTERNLLLLCQWQSIKHTHKPINKWANDGVL